MKVWESTVRRAHSLFSPMSVSPADDDLPVGRHSNPELLLANGDFYTGQWSAEGVPHGTGKYLWSDGCMYEGQWSPDGLPNCLGKFSWPSGATYEGTFKVGFMDGFGTYTAPSGATYKGSWSMNHKHGKGTMSYFNGDFYDGGWLNSLPENYGRYIWNNNNEYSGMWRAGVIHGNGTFSWATGERYEGEWEAGRPVGRGTFRWADDSRYIGVWRKEQIMDSEEEQQELTFPSAAKDFLFAVLNDCKISPGEVMSVFPSQKSFNWSGPFICPDNSNGDMNGRCGGNEETCCSSVDGDQRGARYRTPMRFRSSAANKQGETISKGHKNYELMLNLQLGIRHAVGKQPGQVITLELKASAFDPKEKVWTKFPPEGTKNTPPHQSCDFKWKDYCPLVFRTLRNLFKVDAADYMLSICGDEALRELSSPGKSGSFFYLTNDDRYMIKTMKKSEAKVLIRMLPAYYNHVRSFKNTLVTRFFGLHCVKLTGPSQKKVRFVIMGNLFCSEYTIHRRFDLKGSSLGRITDKPESEIDENTTLKDLDLNFLFRLQKSWFEDFQWQVARDCEFLEQESIMDYSLLVGVHFRPANSEEEHKQPAVRLGVNQTSRVERLFRKNGCEGQLIGEPTGELYNVVLFFGIIDILQDYDISKKLEHAYKSFQYDSTSISAVDPIQYAKRFRDFVGKVFVEDK